MRDFLHAEVTAQASLRPDAPAIVNAGDQLTYGELEETSNRLARLLRAVGCRRGDRVGMLMPKGSAAVAAILGALKADAILVPIDPSSSPEAIREILASCGSKWILAEETHVGVADQVFAQTDFAATRMVGWISAASVEAENFRPAFTGADLEAFSSAPMHWASGPDDAAQILFTLGSSGNPRGVVHTHRNVLAFLRWARHHFGTSADDRLSWHAPLHTNLATFDIFGALGAGAALYPVPRDLGLLPHRLADFIRGEELTQWFSVPSVLSYMASFDAVRYGDFPSVRRILWSGDVIPTPTLSYWMQRMPHASFVHLYSAPEAAVASSYYIVPACPEGDDVEIPIGEACAGAELLVLDDMLRPVPAGDIGDLYVRGASVSPGYWNDTNSARHGFLSTQRGERVYRTGDLARVGSDGLVYYARRANGHVKAPRDLMQLGEVAALRTA